MSAPTSVPTTSSNPTPQPGDLVRLDGPYWGADIGHLAMINGDTGWQVEPQTYMIVFRPSAYLDDHGVSCSGGPCPIVRADQLTLVGTHQASFWRWQDRPRAGGAVYYEHDVNLWSWTGNPTR